MLTGPDGVKYRWAMGAFGMSYPKVSNTLSPRPRRLNHVIEAGHCQREEDGDCRIPPRALFYEETEGATRNSTGGDGHVGLYRSVLCVCGG